MSKLEFFDCNCSVGRIAYPHLLDLSTAGDLEKEMEFAGIEKALVYHTFSRDIDPSLGNGILMKEIDSRPSLFPVWTVLPHHTGEMAPPDQLLREMKQIGVKAVKMFPTKDFQSFSLAEWSCGELLSALEEARVPLLLDIEIVWWENIFSILTNHPKLPVVAINVSYRHNRFYYPLFEKFPNVFVEMSRFFGAGTIEDVVGKFGPGHILFGTNMPQYTGTAAVSMLTYAGISQEDKQAIAGGNLKKLLMEAFS